MKQIKKNIATALAAVALTTYAVAPHTTHAAGKFDLIATNQGFLGDFVAFGQTQGDWYTGALGRARPSHTWEEGGDNVFGLAEINAGYKFASISLEARFSEDSNYQAIPFAVAQVKGEKTTKNGTELKGSAWIGSSLPKPAVLELRLAGSANIESDKWFSPDLVELETLTWKKEDGFSGTIRPFVAYNVTKNIAAGIYAENNWEQQSLSAVAAGLKVSYRQL